MPDARFQPLPGFRDFSPADCAVRNYLFDAWKRVAHRYGFLEWEGPTVEATELYLKKSGGELPTQLFRFMDQGERDITIRPELTASLGRIAAAYQREYTKPLKWFEIGSCFRYEKPQKGRLREFYQFNADILGESSAWADSELIALAIDCMRELASREMTSSSASPTVKPGSVRCGHGVQEQDIPVFLGIVDKFERDRPEECQRKLDAFSISRNDLVDFIENPPAGASERYETLLKDLTARGLETYVKLDLSVVRGLAYYTGLVFEIFDTQRSLRAVAGGGRYDTLVAALSGNAVDMPATGFAMGDAVIGHLIDQTPRARALKEAALAAAGCDVFIIQASENRRAEVLSIASALRDQGYSVDIPLTFTKFNGQMQKAVKSGARLALVVGDEFPTLELRDLTARTSAQIVMEDLFDSIATAANLA